ncbi:MAG: NAD(P)H-binding protein [Myxococcales bacterium]|nr:NAD(P)H-binding protein [Myxococcales bacterium]
MSDRTLGPYLVTGGSGQLGRLVLERLLERNIVPIVATTRTPNELAAYAARGIEVRQANFHEPDQLKSAFAGARRMLLISTSDLAPGERLKSNLAAIDAALAAGIEHIVYTSLTNPRPDSPIGFARDHRETEARLAQLPITHTVLRNNLYMDLLLMAGAQAVATGQLVAAAGNGRAHGFAAEVGERVPTSERRCVVRAALLTAPNAAHAREAELRVVQWRVSVHAGRGRRLMPSVDGYRRIDIYLSTR